MGSIGASLLLVLCVGFAAHAPNPSGTSHHCTQFSLCSLEAGALALHAFLLRRLSLFFAPEFVVNSDSLITVKYRQSQKSERPPGKKKFEELCVGERQRDNGLCSQCAEASNCELKKV